MMQGPEAAADEGKCQEREESEELKAANPAAAFCRRRRRGQNGWVHAREISASARRLWVAISFSYRLCNPSESMRVPELCRYHFVPRWNGDTNFMPVLSGTRMLSEGLQSLYEKLMATQSRLAEAEISRA